MTILRKKFSPSVEMAARTSKILGCSPIANSTTYSSVWNGHYACTCYHPLFVFNQFGDLERCARVPATAQPRRLGRRAQARRGALPGKVSHIYLRADAASGRGYAFN